MRQIQPLQKRSQFGFHYLGVKDLSRLSFKEISEDEDLHRVRRVLNRVLSVPMSQTLSQWRVLREWYIKVVDLSKSSICTCIFCILKFVLLLQDDVNVYKSSPPLPDITRPGHLLPSACNPHTCHPHEDSDDVDSATEAKSDENLSSANFEEEASMGVEDGSPSPGGDLGSSHPKAPREVTCKRKASTSSGEARYVLRSLLDVTKLLIK